MGILASGQAPVPALPGFLNVVAGPLDHYGLLAIALLLLLENIGVPVIPGESALIAGAIFAGTGRAGLNVVEVGLVAVAAAVAGAEIGYLIGRLAGRELILHYGKYVLIRAHHLDRAEAIVSRFGGIVVVIARYIVGLREANGIIAGITQMRWQTFLFFNVVGGCAWVATWVSLGYLAGDHIATIYSNVNRYALYVLLALAVLLAVYIARRVVRRRRAAHVTRESPATEGGSVAEGNSAPEESPVAGGHSVTREAPEATGVMEAKGVTETEEGPETAEGPETGKGSETGKGPQIAEGPVSQEENYVIRESPLTPEVAEADGHPPAHEPSERDVRDL